MIAYVDGAKSAAGWAVIHNRKLYSCGLWRPKEPLDYIIYKKDLHVTKVKVELPKRRGPNSQVKPDSLIKVALWGGWLAGALFPYAELQEMPVEWKGSIDADTMTRRIEGKLAPEELALLYAVKCPDGLRHNIIDAIGMGLKEAYRL